MDRPEARTDQWPAIERLYHEALALEPGAREAFLATACGGDDRLRQEVRSLLQYETAAAGFLTRPALEQVARGQSVVSAAGALVGQQIHGYDVRALLGAGGMGEVYLAADLRLGREVALKVLRRPLGADRGYLQRFEDEARSASVLNHPNIVTIYGVGEQGDLSYIAMERVHGRTLREIIASADLAIPSVLDLAGQLADALAVAHSNGIIHRDLKPDNVMVTPEGLLKVLDFGIAKREGRVDPHTPAPSPEPVSVVETEAGTILGTVGYMSPEQAAGRRAVAASDQFSFGTMLYEMLSGRRAFEGRTRLETLEAIQHDHPVPIQSLNANVNVPLRRLLERCLAKQPADRFPDTRSLAAELRVIRARLDGHDLSRRRMLWLTASAVLTGSVGLAAWRLWPTGPRVRSVAVLEFANGVKDPDVSHLCDGLARSLIQRIGPLPSIRVTPFSLVANVRGRHDIQAVGRELGVESVLSGEIIRRSGHLILTAELTDVSTGKRLWSNTYDRPESDLLAVQNEIAAAIVDDGIRLRLSDADRRYLSARDTADPQAYDLYLRACYVHQDESEGVYLRERELLEQALGRDPSFARAYALLASTYTVMAVDGYESPAEAGPPLISSVRQALIRDPDLPDAHAAAASWEFFFNWNWQNADNDWGRAMRTRGAEINPALLTARAIQQWALGRTDAALRFVRQARALDRLSPSFMIKEGDYLVQAGDLEGAVGLYESAIRAQADAFRAYLGIAEVRRAQGRFEDAIEARRLGHAAAGDDSLNDVLARARGRDGYARIERETAKLQLEALSRRSESGAYTSPTDFARVFGKLGDAANAFRYLGAALAERSPLLVFLRVDRYWDPIRADPRFLDTLSRVHLAL